jgi:hypothetical protein
MPASHRISNERCRSAHHAQLNFPIFRSLVRAGQAILLLRGIHWPNIAAVRTQPFSRSYGTRSAGLATNSQYS